MMPRTTKADGCPIRCPLDATPGRGKSRKKRSAPWEEDHNYLFEEICIDTPNDRDMADPATQANWPDGWWAVSDFNDGYIAYFANEADACAFKLLLIMSIRNGGEIAERYRRALR